MRNSAILQKLYMFHHGALHQLNFQNSTASTAPHGFEMEQIAANLHTLQNNEHVIQRDRDYDFCLQVISFVESLRRVHDIASGEWR